MDINQQVGSGNNFPSAPLPYDFGNQTERLQPSNVQEESEYTTQNPSNVSLESEPANFRKTRKRKAISTPESAAPNKKKTSKGKSKRLKKLTRATPSSKTSVPASTSRDKDCVPFWTESTREWSKKLWSCTKTDCHVLQPDSWNTSLKNQACGSWFTVRTKTCRDSVTSQTIFSQSPLSLSQVIMEKEAPNIEGCVEEKKSEEMGEREETIEKESEENSSSEEVKKEEKIKQPMRARRIRIHPNKDQQVVLRKWFGASRFIYNKVVEITRKPFKDYKELNDKLKVQSLRSQFMSPEFHENPESEWLKTVPFDLKDNAIRDFDKARKAHFAKIRKVKASNSSATTTCHFKYRSKRDKQQSIVVRGRDWNRTRGMYSDVLGKNVMNSSEELPEEMEADFRVVLDRLGHYYICIPRQVAIWSDDQAPKSHHGTVSMDPGVRTFQTCYDADGLVTEWGAGDMNGIFKDCYVADRLQGRIAKTTEKGKRRGRRLAWFRKLEQIQNRINEVHKKLSTWLCRNYRVVLIPKFDCSRMIRRANRKIGNKTARGMCTWAHYRFRQMLISKSELYPWCKVIVCDEAYTSKTCGQCGSLNQTLGSKKSFLCPCCHYDADRDISASRNILLRYLTRKIGPPS